MSGASKETVGFTATDQIVDVQISVRIEKIKETDMWRATSQLVPGLTCYGRTPEQALSGVVPLMAELAKVEHKDNWLDRKASEASHG